MFNAIVLGWFLSFGWVPLQSESVDNHWFMIDDSMTATVSTLGLNVTIDDRFKVFTQMDNFQYKENDGVYFFPYRIDYKIGATVDINKYISVSAEHKCIHVVKYSDIQAPGFVENETKIYATIHGETKIR